MTLPPDPLESVSMPRRQTYGRKSHQIEQPENNLLFQPLVQDDGDETSAPLPRHRTTDWRQRVAELDNASDEDTTDECLEDTLRHLRKGSPRLAAPLVATSSVSSLSTAPVSTPSRRHGEGDTPPGVAVGLGSSLQGDGMERQASEPLASSSTADNKLQYAPDVPATGLFDDGDADPARKRTGGPKVQSRIVDVLTEKPLSKADQQQMLKDIAQAERERPLHLSRPDQRLRPVTAWLKNASVAVEPSSSPGAGQGSDDIQQFTPSSTVKVDLHQDSSGTVIPASSSPLKSSPTLQPKRPPGKFPRFAVLDDEDLTLDGVLSTISKRSNLNARKMAAVERQKQKDAMEKANDKDEDSLDVVVSPSKPRRDAKEQRAPDARAVLNRTTSVPAPSRRQQQLLQWSGKHKAKKDLTETHAEFAAHKFGHADLKRANGGSRPAGQKQGRDDVVQQTQVNTNLLRRHQYQVTVIAKQKEAKYGGGRHLPPKEPLTVAPSRTTSDSHMNSDSDSDDDYVQDQRSAASSDECDADLHSDDVDCDTTLVRPEGGLSSPLSRQSETAPPMPGVIDSLDEEDDMPTPRLRRPKSRAHRRVEVDSGDENGSTEVAQSRHGGSLEPAVATQPSASIDFAGFGSAGGGFSQLFGETQPQHSSLNGDAFAGLRQQEPGLLPSAAHLPSVDISESQALRDKALIAGEAEAEAEGNDLAEETRQQAYLNSQGFFTQTRPADRSSPAKQPSAPGSLTATTEPPAEVGSAEPSSPVLNSSAHLEASPTQASFARLRRRQSSDVTPSSNTTGTKSNGINAFDVLGAGARAISKKQRSKFVEEQAEESDEDSGWFFPRKGDGEEDEEDSGDEDGYVKELVDDAALSTEEKSRLALQAAEKHREITREDDARIEAEAKKVTEGFYRHKRHGNEFMSDEEDDGGQGRKLNKKQRRQRKLDREDGLYKIDGEENKFLEAYEAGLESDVDFEETPASPSGPTSPTNDRLSAYERAELLRNRGRANRNAHFDPYEDREDEHVSTGFAISKRKRAQSTMGHLGDGEEESLPPALRSVENFSKFLADETSNPKRAGGGVSVVQRSNGARASNTSSSAAGLAPSAKSRDPGRESRRLGSSNSVLMDRAKRFAG